MSSLTTYATTTIIQDHDNSSDFLSTPIQYSLLLALLPTSGASTLKPNTATMWGPRPFSQVARKINISIEVLLDGLTSTIRYLLRTWRTGAVTVVPWLEYDTGWRTESKKQPK